MIARRLIPLFMTVLGTALGTSLAFGAEPSPVPAPTASPTASPTVSPAATPAASPLPAPSGTPGPAPSGSSAPSAAVTLPPGVTLPGLTGALGAPQPYALFMKKTERADGLIAIVKKDDDIYFDLGPEQLDHPFIVAPVLASGVGSQAYAGRIYRSFLLEFKRVGKRILWIDKNADFSAPPNSSAANALAISVTDSVINSTPIVAEDEKHQRVTVSAAFFLTDFENIGRDLGGAQQPIILFGPAQKPGFVVDPTKSYLEKTKALPKNVELTANLAFSGPAGDLSGAPDGRGVRLRMHYSIVEPPATSAYIPRLADDRVGYFITAQKRFDNDALSTPFLRYIDRWNFNNGPIVYYLTNEIPAEYKAPIRSALLEWNAAFAKIGIPNAIEVRDQPSDPGWDPDDVRYSTVRWITSDRAAFAASGPRVADPRTGEILRVEIVIDGEALRSIKRGYVDQVAPRYIAAHDAAGLPAPRTEIGLQCHDLSACDSFAADSAELAASATVALRANGAGVKATDRFAEDWLHSVVLHESGHNLGLRHNFISATLYPLGDIHDKRFTQAHGIVGSVMGYTPVNMSPPGQPQGDYFQSKLGPYDYWAIRYGYGKIPNVRAPGDELKALRGIAQESTRPEYAYATDEDAYS
ncbi:MAG: zinc-dependent metalloprotease, partial [Candidatus Eremiobacteraeota bacterium]|nr:zinc-dependent metalloprotease [Candidatus Eremiobacteraeota bacterium]